jgi:DNA-binding transcriptional LysR family regulator
MIYPSTNDSAVDLGMLRLFIEIEHASNISKAARILNLSPSMATRKIATLEGVMKVKLFERTTRKVTLTPAGQIALNWAQHTLQQFDDISDDLTSLMSRPSGQIKLIINHYAGNHYLPVLLNRFCSEYPDIRLSITSTENIASLLEDSYDLALVSGRIPDKRVVAVRLKEFKRILCASPAYIAMHGRPKKPENLIDHDCLVHTGQEQFNWFFRKGQQIMGQPVKGLIEADNNLMLRQFALAGLGIARIGENILEDDIKSGRLIQLLPEYTCVYPTGDLPGLWMVYPQRRVPFKTRTLIEFLNKNLSQ